MLRLKRLHTRSPQRKTDDYMTFSKCRSKTLCGVLITRKEIPLETVIFILKNLVLVFLDVMQIAMLARAIMSWIDRGEGTISGFLTFVTEPFILPIRRLCERMHWFEGTMIDMPFLLTMFVFMILQTLLSVF